MAKNEASFNVTESISKHIALLKPWFAKSAIMLVGEYPIRIILKDSTVGRIGDTRPVFIDKSSKDIMKWSEKQIEPSNVLGLDAKDIDTHFWFHVSPYITENDMLSTRLKTKSIDKLHEAIIVASIWDGLSSALLPALISQLKAWSINAVVLTVLPSKAQPADAQFNTIASLGATAAKEFTPNLLIDRDYLENYVGVDRKGNLLKGNHALNYILEMLSAEETFVQELHELSKPFNTKNYTILSTTGASLTVYDSLENILDTTLFKPLLKFDLSTATLLHVLLRVPLQFKSKLSKEKIELKIARWFKEKADLKSIHVSEPIYVEDASDRIDIIMLVGGFNASEIYATLQKKINIVKKDAVKQGFIKEEEWQGIIKNLTET